MIFIKIKNNKKFMGELFAGNIFDIFQISNCVIKTFSVIKIAGNRNFQWYSEDKKSLKEFCFWLEIKEMVYNVIKGTKTPDLLNIIFMEDCDKNEGDVGVMNLKYENDEINIVVGYNYSTFSMDKSNEKEWESIVITLM